MSDITFRLATKAESTEYWLNTRNVHLSSSRLPEDMQSKKAEPKLRPAVLHIPSLQLNKQTKKTLVDVRDITALMMKIETVYRTLPQ